MKYLTHPSLQGDGTISIATDRGSVQGIMREGVVEWPDDVEAPIGFTNVGVPPANLAAERRRKEIADLRERAAALGINFPEDAPETQAEADEAAVPTKGRKGKKTEDAPETQAEADSV